MERSMMSRGVVTIFMAGAIACAMSRPAGAQERPAPVPTSALQGFSVVLVIGDTQDGQSFDELPASARRALADMKDFLPYKTYRLLDTGWMMGSLPVRSATTRMRGPGNRELELLLLALTALLQGQRVALDADVNQLSPFAPRRIAYGHGRLERLLA